VQALDDEVYQTLLRAYPNHLRLLGGPSPPATTEEVELEPNKQTHETKSK
jgi:hypothetical protein